jgi:FG-GAP-like repeat
MKRVVLSVGAVLVAGLSVLLASNDVAANGTARVSFQTIKISSPLLYPGTLAAGDLTHDGIPDLAIASPDNTTNLAYALGKGNGHFGRWHQDQNIFVPIYVMLADADGDGNLDAVTMYPLIVAFGNGKGGFDRNLKLNTGQGYAVRAVVADLNGDGIPDIVGSYQEDGNAPGGIFVILGKGNREFGNPINFSSGGANPVGIAVADLNHDGIPDLVVANNFSDQGYGNVAVLLGRGDGTFDSPVRYHAGVRPWQLALGDFNGDGNLDVAVGSQSKQVHVLLGNGDGTFRGPILSAGGSTVVAAADFNGDGKLDLVTARGAVSVLLGKGDGTFQPPVNFRVPGFPDNLIVADFNHDGKPDVATIETVDGSSFISILLNTTPFPAASPTK